MIIWYLGPRPKALNLNPRKNRKTAACTVDSSSSVRTLVRNLMDMPAQLSTRV